MHRNTVLCVHMHIGVSHVLSHHRLYTELFTIVHRCTGMYIGSRHACPQSMMLSTRVQRSLCVCVSAHVCGYMSARPPRHGQQSDGVRKAAGWWVRAEKESRKKTEARDTFPPRVWDPTRVAGAGPALAEPGAPAGRAHGAEMVPK